MGLKTTKTQYFFKLIRPYGDGGFSGYKWPPIGRWTPRLKLPLIMCCHGYHLLKPSQLKRWIANWQFEFREAKLYLVEAEIVGIKEYGLRDDRMARPNKVVVRRARLIKQAPRSIIWKKQRLIEWIQKQGIVIIHDKPA